VHIQRCADGLGEARSVTAQTVPGIEAYADADFDELKILIEALAEVRTHVKKLSNENSRAERFEGEGDE
jgi:hypothetical protein